MATSGGQAKIPWSTVFSIRNQAVEVPVDREVEGFKWKPVYWNSEGVIDADSSGENGDLKESHLDGTAKCSPFQMVSK